MLYLCGGGNSEGVRLALRINAAEKRWDRIAILDDNAALHGTELLGVPILGGFDALADADPAQDAVVNLVARTTDRRHAAGEKIRAYGIPPVTLIDPEVDTFGAEVGDDVIVYRYVTLGPESRVEDSSVVFMGAVIGHESAVGPGCVVAANAVLNARVRLGARVYVGTNATIIPEITIGDDATIGAGSVVVQDADAGTTLMGVPAEVLMTRTPGTTARSSAAVPARTALEETIADIWQRMLQVPHVAPTDDFFALGGHSLVAFRVCAEIGTRLNQRVGLPELFGHPTVRDLAAFLAARGAQPAAAPPARDAGGETTTLEQELIGLWEGALGRSGIGRHDDFFDLGGTSLAMVQIAHHIRQNYGVPIDLPQLVQAPTVAQAAQLVEDAILSTADDGALESLLDEMESASDTPPGATVPATGQKPAV